MLNLHFRKPPKNMFNLNTAWCSDEIFSEIPALRKDKLLNGK